MPNQERDIKYINRDFGSFKQALTDFAKTYFPNTFNDFTDADPGTMFIEMASYVGDVLSFYQDNQLQEAFLLYAQEKENLLALAYAFGYRPKVTSTSTVDLTVYQIVPTDGNNSPDFSYSLIVDKGTTVNSVSSPDVSFITQDPVDFSFSSSADPTNVTAYQIDQTTGFVQYFLLQKKVNAIAGTIKSVQFAFGSPQKFQNITITDTNIIQILSAVDDMGNKWYEVPYLAQSTLFQSINNTVLNDPNVSQFSDSVPYLLRLIKVPRRFVSRFTSDDSVDIEFGPGTLSVPDEEVIPNPDNVGIGLVDGIDKINLAYDPSNFLYTQDYGLAPSNTTITFNYMVGGGIVTNVPANDITNITLINPVPATPNVNSLDPNMLATVINSVALNNASGSQGGGDGDTIDQLRTLSQASFATQLRCVTLDDYSIRAMSLPSQFGTIAKVYPVQDQLLNSTSNLIDSNPFAISLYILAFNNNKNLIPSNIALKKNLKTYLSEFRMKTDAVTIKDAFYINLTISFDIIVLPSYNAQEILAECIVQLQDYFNIDRWQINQPIIISDIFSTLAQVKGVQTIMNIDIENIAGADQGYSPYGYDIKGATKNGTIYPSKDPACFEVRFPDTDIFGRVVKI